MVYKTRRYKRKRSMSRARRYKTRRLRRYKKRSIVTFKRKIHTIGSNRKLPP